MGFSQLFRTQKVAIGELHCIQLRNAHNALAFESAVVFGVKYIVYCQEVAVSLVDSDVVQLQGSAGLNLIYDYSTAENIANLQIFCANSHYGGAIATCNQNLAEICIASCAGIGICKEIADAIDGQRTIVITMKCNVHARRIIDPRENLLQSSGGAFFLPTFRGQCADRCFFCIGQLASGHIAQCRLCGIYRRIYRRIYGIATRTGSQLSRTEGVPIVQTDTIQFCCGHNLTGSRGVAVNDQEVIALIQCSVIVVFRTLVTSANYITDLKLAYDVCNLAISGTINDTAPAVFKSNILVILCKIRHVGRSLAIGVDTGVKDKSDKAVDGLRFIGTDSNVDAGQFIQPRQNLVQVSTANGDRIVVGRLNLGQDVLFGGAQSTFVNVTQTADDGVDVLKCSGGTQNDIVLKYQLLCSGRIKGVLIVQRFGHIGDTTI